MQHHRKLTVLLLTEHSIFAAKLPSYWFIDSSLFDSLRSSRTAVGEHCAIDSNSSVKHIAAADLWTSDNNSAIRTKHTDLARGFIWCAFRLGQDCFCITVTTQNGLWSTLCPFLPGYDPNLKLLQSLGENVILITSFVPSLYTREEINGALATLSRLVFLGI
jgi:hypothetical protein